MESLGDDCPKPFATKIRLIGRDAEIDAIREAIFQWGQRRFLYFLGKGGYGKTRLLDEVEAMRGVENIPPFVWSEIIDLYHSENHSPGGVRAAIANGIDPEGAYFQAYFEKNAEYRRQREEGSGRGEIERLRAEQEVLFREAYEKLAGQRRIVLRFDTMELLQFESDEVLRICQIEEVDIQIKDWILQHITVLPNTVVIFAGRPDNPWIQKDLEEGFRQTGWQTEVYELGELNEADTTTFLKELTAANPDLQDILIAKTDELGEGKETISEWASVTEGRPLRLTLIADMLVHGGIIRGDLKQADKSQVDQWLYDLLFKEIPKKYPHNKCWQVLDFLLRARKGLAAGLIEYLTMGSWPDETITAVIAAMPNFAYVKTHPKTKDILFFHDEIYDLHDALHRTRTGGERLSDLKEAEEAAKKGEKPKTGVEKIRMGSIYNDVAQYYRRKLADETLPDDERRELLPTSLYYELQVNAHTGYHRYYARWDEEAIRSYDTGLDMRLRDETLRFFNRYTVKALHFEGREISNRFYDDRIATQIDRAAIDRDCAVRWVKRLTARGKLPEAQKAYQNLRSSQHEDFNWDSLDKKAAAGQVDINEIRLFKAGLLAAHGETSVYSAPEAQARDLLDQAIELLSAPTGWTEDQLWLRAMILGQAHLNIGYLHRSRGRYGLALGEYRQALPHFTASDIPEEEAATRNNMAYILALLGRVELAEKHARIALSLREKTGQKIPLALSHSTMARIFTLQDHPIWAEKHVQDALRHLEDTEQPREYGLVYNTYGFLLRRRGDQWKKGVFSARETKQNFEDGLDYLKKAEAIFTGGEPLRLWESLNEQGSLFCDWGWQAWHQTGDRQAAVAHYRQAIERQTQALQTANQANLTFQAADTYDDLAQAHGDLSFLLWELGQEAESGDNRAQAEEYLNKVDESIPRAFYLQRGTGILQQPPEPGEAYWLSLGKFHLWQSIWKSRDLEYNLTPEAERGKTLEEAFRRIILATIYSQKFWPRSIALNRSIGYFSDMLDKLPGMDKTIDWAYQQIAQVEQEFDIPLNILKNTIEDVLGIGI